MMKKRVIIALLLSSILIVSCVFAAIYVFQLQYNQNFLGRYLSVEMDQSELKNIGQSDGLDVMTFNMKEPYLISLSNDKIYLKDALRSNKMDIGDLCKYPTETKDVKLKEKDAVAYLFENYQMIITKDKCIIAPLNVILERIPL